MANKFVFGSTPINLLDQGETYDVDAASVADGDTCGVPATFPKERLATMQARAYAYGYVLQVSHASDQPAAPVLLTLPTWEG